MSIATTLVCCSCEVLLDQQEEKYTYLVEDAAFGFDDVLCIACVLKDDWQRCECCTDLVEFDELREDQWGLTLCIYCVQECRVSYGCSVNESRQRRTDAALRKASELSEVRDMLKRSSQWVAEQNKRPSEL